MLELAHAEVFAGVSALVLPCCVCFLKFVDEAILVRNVDVSLSRSHLARWFDPGLQHLFGDFPMFLKLRYDSFDSPLW